MVYRLAPSEHTKPRHCEERSDEAIHTMSSSARVVLPVADVWYPPRVIPVHFLFHHAIKNQPLPNIYVRFTIKGELGPR